MEVNNIEYSFESRNGGLRDGPIRYLVITLTEFGDQGDYHERVLIPLKELKEELDALDERPGGKG